MSYFKVTPEVLNDAANSCHATADEISSQLAVLRSYVGGLQGHFTGGTADTFQKLMIDYDVFAKMLHNALEDIGQGLRGNYVNYTEGENQNIASLVPIAGDIPGANL
jgi:WXG100 family type VII secretion target